MASEFPDRKRRSTLVWMLLAVLVVAYNINLRQVSSHDTYASRFVPLSILRDGDLILDEFVPDRIRKRAGDDFFSDYFAYVRGHFYDSHPPVGPLLSLPVYFWPAWTGIPARDELAANLFSKLAASLMAALSAVFLFFASVRLLQAFPIAVSSPDGRDRTTRIALLAVVAYALGTSIWSTASLAMWTHTPAILAFTFALLALTTGRVGAAGVAMAVAVFARPATAPAVALVGIYLLHVAWRRSRGAAWLAPPAIAARRDVAMFVVAGAAVAAAAVLYNYWLFGNAVGGAPFRTGFWVKELGTTGMFTGSLPAGLAGLTVSPNRGIFVYSPVVLVAIAGAVKAWRTPANGDAVLLVRYVSLAALVILLVYSKFIVWWGGHGYGPRYLTDAMPFVGLLFAPGFAWLSAAGGRARLLRGGAILLLVYSVSIQAIGAFCWPSAWTLNDNPPYRYRLWDWSETEIEVCLKDGPRVDPAARALLQRLGF